MKYMKKEVGGIIHHLQMKWKKKKVKGKTIRIEIIKVVENIQVLIKNLEIIIRNKDTRKKTQQINKKIIGINIELIGEILRAQNTMILFLMIKIIKGKINVKGQKNLLRINKLISKRIEDSRQFVIIKVNV